MSASLPAVAAAQSILTPSTSLHVELIPNLLFGSGNYQKVLASLVKMQDGMGIIRRDHTNEHLKSKYAGYDTIVKDVRPRLSAVGLGVLQPYQIEDGTLTITTMIICDDGSYIYSTTHGHPIEKGTCQAVGSSIAYAKRQAYCAMLNAVTGDEDDDGESSTLATAERDRMISVVAHACTTTEKVVGHDGVKAIVEEVLGKGGKVFQGTLQQLTRLAARLSQEAGAGIGNSTGRRTQAQKRDVCVVADPVATPPPAAA